MRTNRRRVDLDGIEAMIEFFERLDSASVDYLVAIKICINPVALIARLLCRNMLRRRFLLGICANVVLFRKVAPHLSALFAGIAVLIRVEISPPPSALMFGEQMAA